MKAVVITRPGGPEVLEWADVPEPEYGPEELLVRVRATAVNRADLLQRMGGYAQPGPKPVWDIPGLEYAGEVAAVGSRVEGFRVGDRVMGLLAGGGYAEYVVTSQRLAMRVPEVMSWREAGGTPEAFITAHDAFRQCSLVAGERVLVHAAGSGVGVAAIQVAKAMGASLVAGTAEFRREAGEGPGARAGCRHQLPDRRLRRRDACRDRRTGRRCHPGRYRGGVLGIEHEGAGAARADDRRRADGRDEDDGRPGRHPGEARARDGDDVAGAAAGREGCRHAGVRAQHPAAHGQRAGEGGGEACSRWRRQDSRTSMLARTPTSARSCSRSEAERALPGV